MSGQTDVPSDLGTITQVSAGGAHTCALDASGAVTCWGTDDFGQTAVPLGLGTITQVDTCGAHTCAVDTSGSVTCWGAEDGGRFDYGQSDVPADLR
jgi:alpha-tubulin suppressor-like RCC1 family protein